jgi:tripartite-type tricarboxylate transporter receptor subunit TctC
MDFKNTINKAFIIIVMFGVLINFAWADEYPSRPIKIIVPYKAGGGVDINARALAPYLEKYLGQTVIVENRTGAGGITGHTLGAKATPDGYTLTMVSPGIVASPWVVKDVQFTPEDYAYIGQVSFVPNFLIVNVDSQWKTLKDLINYAKNNPGKVSTCKISGWPSTNIANAVFREKANINVKVIPGYQGGAEEIAAVLGNHADYSFNNVNEVLPHYEGKTLRVLAAAAQNRSPFLSDVPTFLELGYDVTIGVWRTLAAPSDTPKDILDRVNKALQDALNDDGLKSDFKKVGLTVDYLSPEDTKKFVINQYKLLGEVFNNLGIAIK